MPNPGAEQSGLQVLWKSSFASYCAQRESPLWAAIEGMSASPNKEEGTSNCGFLPFKIPQVRQETTLSEPDKSHTAP